MIATNPVVDRGVPFVVPGYRRCLEMAGVSGRMGPAIPCDPPPPPVEREPLTEVEALMERVEELETAESPGTGEDRSA